MHPIHSALSPQTAPKKHQFEKMGNEYLKFNGLFKEWA